MDMDKYRQMPAQLQRQARRIAERAESVEQARDKLHASVHDAYSAGMSVAQIADASGVTRQTVYAWLGLRTTNSKGAK